MIPIARGAEPPALRASRAQRLSLAEADWRAAGSVDDAVRGRTDHGYSVAKVKETLYLAQHKKCAYCEIRPDFDENAIEHFRPKKHALRNLPGQPKITDAERYWWLTWSWENLLFSCHRCNGASKKANYFPLTVGTAALPLLSTQLDLEQPLLLNPAEPGLVVSQHLAWVPVDPSLHPKRWAWRLETHSDRGEATKKIVEMEYRADDVSDRFRIGVWPRFEAKVLAPIKLGQVRYAHGAWDSLQRELLTAEGDLVFASWCMLYFLRGYRQDVRSAGLPLPGL